MTERIRGVRVHMGGWHLPPSICSLTERKKVKIKENSTIKCFLLSWFFGCAHLTLRKNDENKVFPKEKIG